MWLIEPNQLLQIGEDRLFNSGIMTTHKKRIEHALAHASEIPDSETLAEVASFAQQNCGIMVFREQLLSMLSLYPAERGKLAAVGWVEEEVGELVLDMIAHFFLASHWPRNGNDVDVNDFIAVLRRAAEFMGYSLWPTNVIAA